MPYTTKHNKTTTTEDTSSSTNPTLSPSSFNIWDYRSFVLRFRRYLTDVDIRHTYTPWLPDRTAPITTLKEATPKASWSSL